MPALDLFDLYGPRVFSIRIKTWVWSIFFVKNKNWSWKNKLHLTVESIQSSSVFILSLYLRRNVTFLFFFFTKTWQMWILCAQTQDVRVRIRLSCLVTMSSIVSDIWYLMPNSFPLLSITVFTCLQIPECFMHDCNFHTSNSIYHSIFKSSHFLFKSVWQTFSFFPRDSYFCRWICIH